MNLLAVDTSGPVAGVAVLKDGAVAYEGAVVNKLTHSVNLLPMVEEALGRAGLDISQIDLYAAVTGPGSFTGVRIGVSAVKGLAHGAGKPCVGVDALEALAAGVGLFGGLICPIQDARAGQVYGAAFRAGLPPMRALPDMAEKLPVFLEQALAVALPHESLCFLGDGVGVYQPAIEQALGARAIFPAAHLRFLRPAAVAVLAALHAHNACDYLTLQPMYLRAPQAERARASKLAGESVRS
ncbi:MAG: tRNA (adenosine(37)-N6)-threonylcarbamoyltransferase complex dimerization subunit type 1 TsaB [Clostridia bacterium]